MKIFLLESHKERKRLITQKLTANHVYVDAFSEIGNDFSVIDNDYSCFILSISAQTKKKGIEILKAIRYYYAKTPVLILYLDDEVDVSLLKMAYTYGCDDVVKKPFLMDELEMKLAKICHIRHDIVTVGPKSSFDFSSSVLTCGHTKLHLSRKEARLFSLLFSNKETLVSFETIKALVWEGEYTNLESIRSLVRRLRQKIPFQCIETIVNSGYVLKLDTIKSNTPLTHTNTIRSPFFYTKKSS